jgi:hypothetical protein
MARLDEPFQVPKKLTPLRLFLVVAFLLSVCGTAGYLVFVPTMQLYWGVYARVKPMRSETDLERLGKKPSRSEPAFSFPHPARIPRASGRRAPKINPLAACSHLIVFSQSSIITK